MVQTRKSEQGGFLNSIKAKLGFADATPEYDDRKGDPFYDDADDDYAAHDVTYDEFKEYGPDYREGDAPADPYAPVTTPPVSSSRARTSARSTSSAATSKLPNLVSIDDVRAHTQVPESLTRDPLPKRHVTHPTRHSDADASAATTVPSTYAPAATSDAAYDPYDAYAGSGASAHMPTRALTVIKPASYGDVSTVAKVLRAGDAVVLSLRATPDSLAKRVLDFSFGVSSALDARVDCVADKVFVIARGAGLSDSERASLQSQGVL